MAAWTCDGCTFCNDDDALAQCQECNAVRVVECAKCHGEIAAGARLRVSGKLYHPDCFVCTACKKPFPTPQFSIKDGAPYHSECVPKAPVVPCTSCHKDIGTGPRLTVAEKLYHPDCFVCQTCRKPFPTNQFLIKDGRAYHPNCVPGNVLADCAKCHRDLGPGQRLTVGADQYHPDCFTCTGCHESLAGQKFQIKDNEPYHTQCYKQLYNPRCDVCDDYIPFKADGKTISYKEVPYWNVRFCPCHDTRDRCYSCQRIEPLAPEKHFDVLNDGRKVCHDCCMFVVMDTIELKNVVSEVWEYMESIGIELPKLPLYLVGAPTLNENCEKHNHHAHDHSSNKPVTNHVTRGLCLSEVTNVRHMLNHNNGVSELVSVDQNRSVNAILILYGMPYDLTAQVVAHEATHAFIKLSDSFPDHLPHMVEEGMCQLMSYLFLKYKQTIEEDSSARHRGDFAVRLREFLVQQIENDETPSYGDGFRAAHAAYKRVHSLQAMFDSLRLTGQFP